MLSRLPIVPTLVVLAAVAVMIWLGVWQLDRKAEKEALLARYVAAQSDSAPLGDLANISPLADVAYRKVSVDCTEVAGWSAISGLNAKGESGISHVARCNFQRAVHIHGTITRQIDVAVGWSRSPDNPAWLGGRVDGTFVASKKVWRVVADPPLAGLQANARPDPRDLPNNHLAYAVQWFLFALTALVIYALALRKRLAGAEPPR